MLVRSRFKVQRSLFLATSAAVPVLCSSVARAVYYTATVLTNSSFPGAQGMALNDNNVVTGYYYNHVGGGHYEQPFLYNFSTNTYSVVAGFSSTSNYVPTGINNSGVIVGSDQTTGKGFVDNAGSVTEISPLAGSTLTFSGVNTNGIAVGTSTTSTTGVTRAVIYNSTTTTLTDVGTGFSGPVSAGYSNVGYGINSNGQVEALGVDTGGTSTPANANAIAQPFIATPNGSGGYTYNNVGNVIDPTDSNTYSQFAGGIDAQGNITGSVNKGGTNNETAYLFNTSTSTYTIITGSPSNGNVIADVNGVPSVAGNYYPYIVADGSHSQGFPMFLYQNGAITDLYNFAIIKGVNLGNGLAINSVGSILATGTSSTAGPVTVLLTIDNTQVIYTGAASNSWDSTSANFSPSTYADGDLVVFDDTATGSTSINIPNIVNPQAVTFNNSSKSYAVSGSAIAGAGTYLNVTGGGQVTLNNANTYTGPTNVSAGTLIIGSTGSIASSAINVTGGTLRVENGGVLTAATPATANLALTIGGTVKFDNSSAGSPTVVELSKLYISGSTDNWTGKLDLANNALIGNYGSTGQINLAQVTNQVKAGFAGGTWTGNGITSSAAAADSTHLTALGVILNSTDGTTYGPSLYSTFDGVTVYTSYVLVGLTYYGDANLDGQVDGSDYSLIDNGYLTQATGWYNGDFNYDGVIDGSDYTLIDNAFNNQGANLGGGSNSGAGGYIVVARSTSEIANETGAAAVPEPATLSLLSVAVLGMLGRRRALSAGTVHAPKNEEPTKNPLE